MPLLSMTLLSTPPLLLLLLLLLLHSSTVQVHGSIPRAPARAPALAAVSPVQLPLAEVEALLSIYHENGGAQWQYKKGTDAVGGGMPWNVINMGGGRFFTSLVPAVVLPDPCSEGWFGVECLNGHVSKLFINTRYSGNKMTGVRLFELFLCYMCSSCCTCVCWFSDWFFVGLFCFPLSFSFSFFFFFFPPGLVVVHFKFNHVGTFLFLQRQNTIRTCGWHSSVLWSINKFKMYVLFTQQFDSAIALKFRKFKKFTGILSKIKFHDGSTAQLFTFTKVSQYMARWKQVGRNPDVVWNITRINFS